MKKNKNNTKSKQLRPINSPVYRYWQALYMAFYSRVLYMDVAKNWKGFGYLYLWLVIAIGTIPLSLKVIFEFNQYFDQKIMQPIKLLPPILVQNGEVKFDQPMPYKIKNPKGEVVAIIDTTGEITQIKPNDPNLTLLITKKQIIFNPPQLNYNNVLHSDATVGEPTNLVVHTLKESDNEVFDARDWLDNNHINILKLSTEILVYPLLMIFFLAIFWTLILLITILGQLIARVFFDLRMTFKQTCRVLAVSATPAIIFVCIAFILNTTIPGLGLICIALQAIYFCYAIIAIKRSHTKLVYR